MRVLASAVPVARSASAILAGVAGPLPKVTLCEFEPVLVQVTAPPVCTTTFVGLNLLSWTSTAPAAGGAGCTLGRVDAATARADRPVYDDARNRTVVGVSRSDAEWRGERVVDVPDLRVAALDELSRHAWRAGPGAAPSVTTTRERQYAQSQHQPWVPTCELHRMSPGFLV